MMRALWIGPLMIVVSLSAWPLSARAGHGEENGGNGTGTATGAVVLDDLENAPDGFVDDNYAFLQNVPDFHDLIHAIAQANPVFAAKILKSLEDYHIYLTSSPLPDLPASDTNIAVDPSNVQIAIESGDELLISLPALKRTEQSYFFLHEGLNALVPGDGIIHHELLRSIVDSIYKNRDTLTSDVLDRILDTYDPDHKIVPRGLGYNPMQRLVPVADEMDSYVVFALGSILPAAAPGADTDYARCAVLALSASDDFAVLQDESWALTSFWNSDKSYATCLGTLQLDLEGAFPAAKAFFENAHPTDEMAMNAAMTLNRAWISPQDETTEALALLLLTPATLNAAPANPDDAVLLQKIRTLPSL